MKPVTFENITRYNLDKIPDFLIYIFIFPSVLWNIWFAGEPEVHHRRFRRTKYQDSGRPVQPGGQETDPASEGPLASRESLKEEVGRSYVVVSKLCRRVGSIFRILYANNPFTGRIQ